MEESDQKLHIVAAPLHHVFRQIISRGPALEQDIKSHLIDKKPEGIFVDPDVRLYLVSAHVEKSESRGFSSLIEHLSGHFHSIADYIEGEKIGKNLLKSEPSDLIEIKKLSWIDQSQTETNEKRRSKRSSGGSVHGMDLGIGMFLLIYLGLVTLGFYGLDLRELFDFFSFLPSPYYQIVWGIYGFFVSFFGFGLIYIGFKDYPETEKSALTYFFGGVVIALFGLLGLLTAVFPPFSQFSDLVIVSFHFVGLNLFYLLGVFAPRWRIISILAFIVALEVVFLQWFPSFLIGIGIPTSSLLQLLFFIGFALLISVFIGFFFNFMKSVEVILELEHSFALFVGRRGASRTVLRQKLAKIMGIEEKQGPGLFERITSAFRVYLGFRPQGTIEFHLGLSKESGSSTDTTQIQDVLDYALFPVTDVVFDGTTFSLEVKARARGSSYKIWSTEFLWKILAKWKDMFHYKIPKTVEEELKLISEGWEFRSEKNGIKTYARMK